MSYKIELHAHTSLISPCGKMSAKELVDEHIKAGYSAICICDHYRMQFFDDLGDSLTWAEKNDKFMEGWREVYEYGKEKGLVAIFGIELRFEKQNINDYLVYGVDRDFLVNNPDLDKIDSIETFIATVRKDNPQILVIQAHPCRRVITPLENPEILDGFEVINLNPRQRNHHIKANSYRQYEGKVYTSGSDTHQLPDVARGGIMADTLPKDSHELADLLRSGNFTLLGKDVMQYEIDNYLDITEEEKEELLSKEN